MGNRKTINMKLTDAPFEAIASGQKTVEVRLNDEKRKTINVGDHILFSRVNDPTEAITAEVVDLFRFDTFFDLYSSELFSECGVSGTVAQAVEGIRKYYSKEQEEEFGALGIRVKLVN